MTETGATFQGVKRDLDALVADLLGSADAAGLIARAERLETSLAQSTLSPRLADELTAAIGMVRAGNACAAVSALLAVRSEFGDAERPVASATQPDPALHGPTGAPDVPEPGI